VLVHQGASPPTAAELAFFSEVELTHGWRLACQCRLENPLVVEVPASSLLGSLHKILQTTAGELPATCDPPVQKQPIELELPAQEDDRADLVRFEDRVGKVEIPLELLRQLPQQLRRQGFKGVAVLGFRHQVGGGSRLGFAGEYPEESGSITSTCHPTAACSSGSSPEGSTLFGIPALLDFQPSEASKSTYSLAFDIGTTTLVAALIELPTGRQLSVVAELNPQTRKGDDVISRIQLVREHPEGLAELHELVISACNRLLSQLCRQTGIDTAEVYEATFAGNTTMLHLLAGLDVRALGELPFVPVFQEGLLLEARQLGLRIHPRGRVYIFPVIGGFVGGDTVAGILATRIYEHPEPMLLVDIGTNGEIVLSDTGRLIAAATAAGPAFEGARISQGMRAAAGAIERVIFDGKVQYSVIGNVPPIGLCGSALIDLAAELLRHRLLRPDGRLCSRDQLAPDLPGELRDRVVCMGNHWAFLLVRPEESPVGRAILLTQPDVRQLQLASGAIRAGIRVLLHRAGLGIHEVHRILLAGGFGNFIRPHNAQRMGLLPPEIETERIQFVGNASLAGARLAAVSLQARETAEKIAHHTEHVELSMDPRFRDAFAEAMYFPEE